MGIYITGMEMPINDKMEPTAVWVYPNGYVIVFKERGKLQQYTKAIPVPPHIDLIERDELIKRALRAGPDDDSRWVDVFWIENAPTIIPASEAG